MKKKIIAVALLAAVSLGAVGTLTACGGGDSSAAGTAQVDSGALTVGSSISADNWDITLDSIEATDRVKNEGEYSFGQHIADDGMTFLLFHLTVKNNNTEADNFMKVELKKSNWRCKVLYQNEYQYEAVNLIGIDNDFHNLWVQPLQTTSAIVGIEVPKDIVDFDNMKFQIFKATGPEFTFDLKGYRPEEDTVSSAAAASSSSATSSETSSAVSSEVSSETSSVISSEASSETSSVVSSEASSKEASSAVSSEAATPKIVVDDSMLNKIFDVSTVFPGKTKLTVADLENLFNREGNTLAVITNDEADAYNKENAQITGNEIHPQAIATYEGKYEFQFPFDENDTASKVYVCQYVGGHGIGGF